MSDTKRYDPVIEYIGTGDYTAKMEELADGSYVALEDYERLQSELAQAQEQLREAKEQIQLLEIDIVDVNQLRAESIANLTAETKKLMLITEYFGYILPMAKGFSIEHDIGSNKTIVIEAEQIYRDLRGEK